MGAEAALREDEVAGEKNERSKWEERSISVGHVFDQANILPPPYFNLWRRLNYP